MHVYPQRDRMGFCDVLINEEGRHHLEGQADDYELFLAEAGYAGQEFAHGVGNNEYMARAWHLPEHLHPTNWTVREMCRFIHRRDPTRPAFWLMSFNCPHPPLVPLETYLDLYRDVDIPEPFLADWAKEVDRLPYAIKQQRARWSLYGRRDWEIARRAFFALCTHIDHQIRLVIGTLREAGLLDNTIICFFADHGDMVGNNGLSMGSLYEDAAHIPLIIIPTADYEKLGHHQVDDRLVEIRDIMPTLLDLADIPIPDSVEGLSLLSDTRRKHLYGEWREDDGATRTLRDQRYKLIYYPVGNRVQLFDLREDPDELHNLADDPAHANVREDLIAKMVEHFYGSDLNWVRDGRLVGLPDKPYEQEPNRTLNAQRGWRFM